MSIDTLHPRPDPRHNTTLRDLIDDVEHRILMLARTPDGPHDDLERLLRAWSSLLDQIGDESDHPLVGAKLPEFRGSDS